MSEAFHSNLFEVEPLKLPSYENYETVIPGSGKLNKNIIINNFL